MITTDHLKMAAEPIIKTSCILNILQKNKQTKDKIQSTVFFMHLDIQAYNEIQALHKVISQNFTYLCR